MSNWERTDNSAWDACTNFEFHNEFLMEDTWVIVTTTVLGKLL